MSENQTPLSEEQNAEAKPLPSEPAENQDETGSTAAPTGELATSEDDVVLTPAQAEEEIVEEIDPADVKIFGMPRMCFHGAAFGVAAGYILTGLIGMAIANIPAVARIIPKMPSATVCALVCAGIGYLITNRIYKKRKAEKEAAGMEPPDVSSKE